MEKVQFQIYTLFNTIKGNVFVSQVGLLSKLRENMTVFVPTREAVKEFNNNLMEFNTLELENSEKNEVYLVREHLL